MKFTSSIKLGKKKDHEKWVKKSERLKAEEEKQLVNLLFIILHVKSVIKKRTKRTKKRLSKRGMIYKVNKKLKEHQQKMYYKRKYSRLSSKLASIGLNKDEVVQIYKNVVDQHVK